MIIEKSKCRVVQHVAGYNQIGGPAMQLRKLLNSSLAEKYNFKIVSQDYPAGGINLRLILDMAAAMREFQPHLVHVRGLQNEGFHGILAAYMAGVRNVLVSVHGFSGDAQIGHPFKRWVISQILEPLTLYFARHVYCVSSVAAQRPIVRRCAGNKCSVIHNGIDISSPLPRNDALRAYLGAAIDDVVALYVGRIVRDKGLFVLAEALKKMQNPPVVWLAGDGPDTNSLRTALGTLVESGHVRFLGRREDIPELLGACDFFLFPTLHENLSNALLEAMHAGRAVLATSVGGNPELVVDGVTGKLIPANDILALVKGMEFFISQVKLREKMGECGRKRIEQHFSINQVAAQLDELYDRLIHSHC